MPHVSIYAQVNKSERRKGKREERVRDIKRNIKKIDTQHNKVMIQGQQEKKKEEK